MNLRQRENVLVENIQLKQENVELGRKINDLMDLLNSKMSLMVDALNQIRDKPTVINQTSKDGTETEKRSTISSDVPVFIPTLDSSELKMNVQEIKKKIRKSNIEDSLNKLSKLQEKL